MPMPCMVGGVGGLGRASKGLLSATTDAAEAVRTSDVSIVCVGTPSLASGRLNLDYVRKVSEQISAAIAAKGSRHVVIFRSTMLPGSTVGVRIDPDAVVTVPA